MKALRWFSVCASLALSFSALVYIAGCDNSVDTEGVDSYFDKDNANINQPRDSQPGLLQVSPKVAQASFVGQKINFTAQSGTAPYRWEVAIPANGSVSPLTGEQTVYTVSAIGNNNVIVYDNRGQSAVATISTTASNATSSLMVTPNNPTLDNNGDMITLTASGGTPPYDWVVYDTNLGDIVNKPADTRSVVYQRKNSGDNAITVTDSAGQSISVVIDQP